MEVTIAIITSSIAIVVAIISGIFSYLSTKRSSKVEAMKGYLSFLEHKMNKLEESLDEYDKLTKGEDEDEDSDIPSHTASLLRKAFKHNGSLLVTYSYLFTQNMDELSRLTEKENRIGFSLAAHSVKGKYEVKDEYKSSVIPLEELVSEISTFNKDVRSLIIKELNSTFHKFEELSLLD